MDIIYNQELNYKEICEMMGEKTLKGGSCRNIQLVRWQKNYEIVKPKRGKYVIKKELTKEEKISKKYSRKRYDLQLQDFAKKRFIKILTPIDGTLKSTDVIQYECLFHPGIIQESQVRPLLKTVGCPLCGYQMSRFETMLYLGIKDAKHRNKIEDVEYDIISPNQKIAIEVDGVLYHSGANELEKEANKYKVAERNGYRLIKIYEQSLAESKGIFRKGGKLYVPPFSSANKENRKKIISLVQELVPYEHTETLWDEAAVYMRDWKYRQTQLSKGKPEHFIRQYDNNGKLVAEYKNFNEIKKTIALGNAFGFNWEVK